MADNAVTIAGDLGQPAMRLIEKISDAIGGIAKPWQITRVAKAETQAEIIRAEGRLQISELERRGLERFVKEEGKNQENIENIVGQAAEHLDQNSKPEEVEEDWIRHFFDRCKLTSDQSMQSIWARILAGEANNPGIFSRRTVDILSSIDKRDASMFSSLSAFILTEDRSIVALYDIDSALVKARGLNFTILSDLESIGLIKFNNLSGFTLSQKQSVLNIEYGASLVQITIPPTDAFEFKIGSIILTESGRQLMRIVDPIYDQAVLEHWISVWQKSGLNPKRFR